jgi:hypothetical protein
MFPLALDLFGSVESDASLISSIDIMVCVIFVIFLLMLFIVFFTLIANFVLICLVIILTWK